MEFILRTGRNTGKFRAIFVHIGELSITKMKLTMKVVSYSYFNNFQLLDCCAQLAITG